MKSLIKRSVIALLAIFSIASCKKDKRTLDLTVSAVSTLNAPADQTYVKLQPATGSSMVFQWSAAQAADGDLVLYEIVFDKADGDFSHPVYKTVSDGLGVQAQATLTQKDLNKIASLAGVQASSAGKIKWAVLVSKSTNVKMSSQTRTLTIERPAGFAVLPGALYLTGTATEAGADISKAIPLKKTAEGIFELYTSLQAGTYQLSDQPNATGTKYYVDSNGIIQQGSSSTTVTGATKVYRVSYDFNVATTQTTEIQSLGLYMSAYDKEIGQLSYIGNSTWEAATIPVQFYPFSWGRDERYKFIMHTAAGLEYFGSENANNVSPGGQPVDYFYLLPVTNAQWDNTYKFDPSADMHNVKVDAFFNASGTYFHKVTTLN